MEKVGHVVAQDSSPLSQVLDPGTGSLLAMAGSSVCTGVVAGVVGAMVLWLVQRRGGDWRALLFTVAGVLGSLLLLGLLLLAIAGAVSNASG
ncbi:hypothetical protein JQS43_19540 [Natronosporangium hydrolyticum]|uniref:Uncharacterized protein n=1 Tax=Natronosporangium hydrolyticum TaxID=2811111 RepID=A0A895Y8S7_9ACTN|nr:hypothetical protein [Natronosporangium hydrolyticum]QSB13741.1 hypothetical protein JQS43_19540 [Natronosporangium hydrolyticum]